MSLTIGVTGATGYVGQRIVAALTAAGHDCIQLVRQPRTATERGFVLGAPPAAGLCTGLDVLVHCAWDMRAGRAAQVRAINIEGSRLLLEAGRAAGVQRTLFISSMSAFAGCRSLYGNAKLEVEAQVAAHGGTTIRPGLIYGPQPGGVVGAVLQLARRSRWLPMVGTGQFALHTCHEDDLVALLVACCSDLQTGLPPLLYAAEPTPRAFRDIVTTLANRPLHFIPVPWRLIWTGLKALETLGLRPRLKSDSLLGLVYSDPAPDFANGRLTGLSFRPLEAAGDNEQEDE